MANWVTLEGSEVAFKSASNTYFEKGWTKNDGSVHNYGLTTYIEYDLDRTTATQTIIRFRGKHSGGSGYASDSCYVLYNPNNNPESIGQIVSLIKRTYSDGGRWNNPEDCKEIKLTKKYTDQNFTLQDYWICNNGGYTGPSPLNSRNGPVDNPADFVDYASEARKNYTQQVKTSQQTFQILGTQASSVTEGTVSIVDNFNNSYTVKGQGGGNGTNNPVESATLEYTKEDGTITSVNCETLVSKKISFTPTGTNATRSVKAGVTTVGKYNTKSVSTTKDIKQYVGPNAVTKLKISYNKSRLTLKENWTLAWAPPTTNNGCPIKGYRIRLYRKRGEESWIKLPIYDSNGNMGHVIGDTTKSPTDYYWDRDGTKNSATIYTKYYNKEVISAYPDILPGDKVKFAVTAYTKYGENYDGTVQNSSGSTQCFKTGEAFSGEYNVQNAGIVRVKVNGAWKEGQVYVKAGGTWHEAETVNVKTSSGWKESQ
jgi:hypothetical protein